MPDGASVTGNPRTGEPMRPKGPQSGTGNGIGLRRDGEILRQTSGGSDSGQKQNPPYTSPAPPTRGPREQG